MSTWTAAMPRWGLAGGSGIPGEQETGATPVVRESPRHARAPRQHAELFRRAFESWPILATVTCPTTGRVLEVNRTFCSVFGFRAEEVVGRTTTELGIWEDPSDRDRLLAAIAQGLSVTNQETLFRTKGGEILTVLLSAEQVRLTEKTVLLVFGVDISTRKRAERQLEASEQLLTQLVDGIRDGLVIVDGQTGRFVRANAAICRMTGFTLEELQQRGPEQLYFSDAPIGTLTGPLSDQHSPQRPLPVVRRKDGTLMAADISVTPLRLLGRECGVAVIRDATERRRAEDALRESEATFAAIFQGVGECIVIADVESRRLLDLNATAAATFGYQREEARLLLVEDLYPAKDHEAVRTRFAKRSLEAYSAPGEALFRRRDGSEFFGEVATSRMPLKGKLCLVGVIRDVTARHQAQKAFQERMRLMERVAHLTATNPGVVFAFKLCASGARRLTEVGERCEELLGVPRAALRRDSGSLLDVVHPADRKPLVDSIGLATSEASPWNHLFRVIHPTKGIVWIDGQANPAQRANGILVWHGVLLDVTARQRLETRQRSEQAASRVLASADPLDITLPRLLEAICEAQEWLLGEIWLPDAVTGKLVRGAWWHPKDPCFNQFEAVSAELSFARGEGLPGETWALGRRIVLENHSGHNCCWLFVVSSEVGR